MKLISFLYAIFAIHLTLVPFCVCGRYGLIYGTSYGVVIDAKRGRTDVDLFGIKRNMSRKLMFHNIYHNTTVPGIIMLTPVTDVILSILKDLLEEVKKYIPEGKLPLTSLQLMATDVTLYPEHFVQTLLKKIEEYFKTTGFKVSSDSVSTMGGRLKFYDWEAVNLLLGRIENKSLPTAAIIDVGYSSSHVAFDISHNSNLIMFQKKNIVNWTIHTQSYKLYGESISKSGAYEIRAKVIEQGKQNGSETYRTPCLHPKTKTTWKFRLKTYKVEGEGNKTVNLSNCMASVRKALADLTPSAKVFGQEVYGLSFLYRTAVESRLAKQGKNMNVSLQEIRFRARQMCQYNVMGRPFMCMDLAYIYMLLRKIFGLKNESRIVMTTKLSGVNVTWTLGAAFQKYHDYITWGLR